MITPEDALKLIIENTPLLAPESVPLGEAVGRVLAGEVVAREDLPPFDNSAMDGYAVRVEDCAGASPRSPAVLRVRETVRAGGGSAGELRPGEAARIMTGAPTPPGAGAVVMKELTASDGNGRVGILHAPEPGEHIRRHGEDVRAGEVILRRGALLRPYEVALLAAQGIGEATAVRRPAVSVMATGDELVGVREPLAPGRIRNSNGPALAAALTRWGAIPRDLGIVPDDRVRLRGAFEEGLRSSDALLVTGGVSAGDFDFTKALLEELGLRTIFWKAAIKPGKPLLFGLWEGRPVFGLPGNPVSALVCAEEFVRPALEKMQGRSPSHPSYHLTGVLENEYFKPEDRRQYLFCRVAGMPEGFSVHVIRPQGSAMLGMATRANALAIGPLGVGRLEKGMPVRFRWLK